MTSPATDRLRHALAARSREEVKAALAAGASPDEVGAAYFPLALLAEFPARADELGEGTWDLVSDLLRAGAQADRTYLVKSRHEVTPDRPMSWDEPYRVHPCHRHLEAALTDTFHTRDVNATGWAQGLRAWGKTAWTARSDVHTSSLACLRAYLDLGQARELTTPATWALVVLLLQDWLSCGLPPQDLARLGKDHLAHPALTVAADAYQGWVRQERLNQIPPTPRSSVTRRRA